MHAANKQKKHDTLLHIIPRTSTAPAWLPTPILMKIGESSSGSMHSLLVLLLLLLRTTTTIPAYYYYIHTSY